MVKGNQNNSPNSPEVDVHRPQLSPAIVHDAFPEETLDRADAPPVYALTAGNDERNVATTALNNGRFSVEFKGRGHENAVVLPPLPEYEPALEQVREEAVHSHPTLNIVIQVVGSRGDVQPFLALGQELQRVGHRVRIATHDVFHEFVRKTGLEFYPIGGDPSELMAYMVKNPGIIPKIESIKAGDISKKRKMVSQMLNGCWDSCIKPDPISGAPFVAEAIIANPPSFAHVHCAQALGIPVHLMFTMPWTATRAFPQPLANVKVDNTDPNVTNFLSYGLVDMLTWQGLGGTINRWRKSVLQLEPVAAMVGANLAQVLNVPFTYCWSPALIPKPYDWPSHIDVCGFFFRESPSYTPPPAIDEFLRAGPPPIYIGFGSIVMENPEEITRHIIEAVRTMGVRAIISRGWSKLGAGNDDHPGILFIDDCPHEWLFKRVAAVIHHGGAGTTACGLLNGRPTAIVPFFGDQPFWANMVASAGAGPPPLSITGINAAAFVSAFETLLAPATLEAAAMISQKMSRENGVQEAVNSFHRHLPVKKLACDFIPSSPAVWQVKKGERTFKLSYESAKILIVNRRVDAGKLKLYKANQIILDNKRWDPVTATVSAYMAATYDLGAALGSMVQGPIREYRKVKSLPLPDEEKVSNSSRPGSLSESRSVSTEFRTPSSNPEHSSTASTVSTNHSNTTERKKPNRNAEASLAATKAVGIGFGRTTGAISKTIVDLPLAFTEGLHNVPHLYGEEVRDYGAVTDFKTGSTKGMKSFAYGMWDGYTGLFVKPYEGAKQDGALGFAKGLAKGTSGFLTHNGAAMLGLWAYPAQGVYKSINALTMTGTQGGIMKARKELGEWMAAKESRSPETQRVLSTFDKVVGQVGTYEGV